jgi:chloramphenicol-sensitive protein RarD
MRVGNTEGAKGKGGLLYGLAAHGMWGLMPLYIWALDRVPSLEILAHRVVWCSVFLVLLVTVFHRWGDLGRVVRNPRTLGLLTLSSLLIAGNWFCYIYGANSGQTIQTSLGYFINPLFSVLLGMVFFGERLRPVQWFAVLLAAVGVLILIIVGGQLPWIALVLAVSFGFYGLVRKVTPVNALIGLTVETLVLVPVAAGSLLFWTAAGTGSFGKMGWDIDALLLSAGVVTAVPLLCFGQAARRLPLTTLGLLQYIAPTIQFLLAVLKRGEAFEPAKAVSFGFIWTALVIFSVESLLAARRRQVDEKRRAGEAQPLLVVSSCEPSASETRR